MGYGGNRGQVRCGECGRGEVDHIGHKLGHTFVRATVTGAMGSDQPRWRGPDGSPRSRRTTRTTGPSAASRTPSPGVSSTWTDLLAFCCARHVAPSVQRALLERLATAHRVSLPVGREPQFTDVLWRIPETAAARYLAELRRREAAGEPLVRGRLSPRAGHGRPR